MDSEEQWWRRRESNPQKSKAFLEQQTANPPPKIDETSSESDPSPIDEIKPEDNSPTRLQHHPNTFLQQKCALCVPHLIAQLPAELKIVIEAWSDLSEEVKGKILQLIKKEPPK